MYNWNVQRRCKQESKISDQSYLSLAKGQKWGSERKLGKFWHVFRAVHKKSSAWHVIFEVRQESRSIKFLSELASVIFWLFRGNRCQWKWDGNGIDGMDMEMEMEWKWHLMASNGIYIMAFEFRSSWYFDPLLCILLLLSGWWWAWRTSASLSPKFVFLRLKWCCVVKWHGQCARNHAHPCSSWFLWCCSRIICR